jgi:hypothetical protein
MKKENSYLAPWWFFGILGVIYLANTLANLKILTYVRAKFDKWENVFVKIMKRDEEFKTAFE